MPFDLIQASILVSRALAISFGLFCFFDALACRYHWKPDRFDPFLNTLGWGIVAAGAVTAGVTFIVYEIVNSGFANNPVVRVAVMFIWTCLAAGLMCRAASRAAQPRLIILSAAFLYFGGTTLVALRGAV